MNAAMKHIRVAQGVTTKVYRYYNDSHCIRVVVTHAEVKPVIFRAIRKSKTFTTIDGTGKIPRIVRTTAGGSYAV